MSGCVLYVEDDPNDQRFVRKVLERFGYDVLVAADGATGVRLAQAHAPDLILIDIQMPGLDGLETARRIRALAQCADTPLVALTAYSERHRREAYLEAGFTAYQQKLAGIKPLLDLVRQYLPG